VFLAVLFSKIFNNKKMCNWDVRCVYVKGVSSSVVIHVFYTNVFQNKLHVNVITFSTTLSAVVLFLVVFFSNIFEVKS
jgi:hypothetical protein